VTAPGWVLLRGLTRDRHHWGCFPEALKSALPDAPWFDCPDLPGNGRRYAESSPVTIAGMVETYRRDLAGRNRAGPFVLLAVSMGAMVAIEWARRHPGEIAGLVVVNTSAVPLHPLHWRLRPSVWPSVFQLLTATGDPRASEAAIWRMTSANPPDAAVIDDWAEWRRRHPLRRRNAIRQLIAAARFRLPETAPGHRVLVVGSEGDRLVDPRCSPSLARHWNVRLAMHRSAGHDLPLDAPDWLARTVADWWHGLPA